MPPAAPPPPSDTPVARLLEGLEGLDLTSADGRAGIRTLLAEIERLSPGAIIQQAARIDLRRAGWAVSEPKILASNSQKLTVASGQPSP